jgi:transcriptional regulator with XRE-family HTH domain
MELYCKFVYDTGARRHTTGGKSRVDVPRLRQLRQQAILSQEQLAEKSGVARDTISKLETGQRRAYPRTIHRLAAGLDVEPRELIGEGQQREPTERPAQGKDHSEDEPKKKMGF